MNIIFKDKNGRTIKLTNERMKHITKHPEMQNKLHWIEIAIIYPDFIEEDLYRSKIIYYYKYLKEEKKYIMVVIKFEEDKDNILTAYLVKK